MRERKRDRKKSMSTLFFYITKKESRNIILLFFDWDEWMRHTRLRSRSSILVILATLTAFFLITLYTLIWSTTALEREEKNSRTTHSARCGAILVSNQPPEHLWSSCHTSEHTFYSFSKHHPSRIEELYQLIRAARNDELHASQAKQIYPVDQSWDFHKLVEQTESGRRKRTNPQKSETHGDTADQATSNQTEDQHYEKVLDFHDITGADERKR